jgi:hypothetical protein
MSGVKETLRVINQMVKDKVIEQYAIGGAVAAIYYLEPFDTADLDIFVQASAAENDLMILTPIYDYLIQRDYKPKGEFINIEGLPVQFLPVFNPLTDEAVREAKTIRFERVPTRIMRPEHLVAIMLDTGRPKDYLRIGMFLEQGAVQMRSLNAVLRRHGLMKKWKENEYKFLP